MLPPVEPFRHSLRKGWRARWRSLARTPSLAAAVKRIVAGTQTMTVYKPISKLADEAADIAVQLAKGNNPSPTPN
ncbi:D-xylose-binding periplasmic protein precursor [Serratia fonticola]|uniref:D-xylose-binding periplasmic protein n=1 Tax=Serratia fonticola TaxID=47917 RepID=A0A4U9VFE6_SERFO|nr:D-xylose-binding periplasmic protein precursor [Serratia fonticola]